MSQEIGETRSAMTDDLLSKKIYNIANDAHRDRGLNKFWILISAKPDNCLVGVIRESVKVTNFKPPKMLNSMCFYVNWQCGEIRNEWVLPLDLGVDIPGTGCGGQSALVYDSAKDMAGVLS